MTEADFKAHFAALNEHLEEVRPLFEDFCSVHGFVFADRRSLGRYPRVRIRRSSSSELFFELWMELDKNGRRFEKFHPDLPYGLEAGAYLDVPDGSKYGLRLQKGVGCFSGVPFSKVGGVLIDAMEKYLPIIESWDAEYLKENGTRVQFGS